MKVSVIVTVLNEEKTILLLLDALSEQTHQPEEVVVADGGSNDKTVALLTEYQKISPYPLRIIEKKGNRSVGRNQGIKVVKNALIAITDAGCIPHRDWLEELVKKYTTEKPKNTGRSIVIAGYYDAKAKTSFEEAIVPYVLVMPDKVNPSAFLPATRSMLLEKNAWKLVGGFDERLAHNEDYAFAKNIEKNKNISLYFTKVAKVSWIPRSSLGGFANMIFRFAKGDAQAGIWRPKVLFIFARYLAAIVISIFLFTISIEWVALFWIVGITLYSLWAILKNVKYVPVGWYWLPILQIVSDIQVMLGTLAGSV